MTLNQLQKKITNILAQHPEQGDEELGLCYDGDLVSFGDINDLEFEDLSIDEVADEDCAGPGVVLNVG